jgi:PAS domain S-box-containing protein
MTSPGKKSDQALRDSEKRFRTLVDQASDAIFVSDIRGHLVDVNRRACESLGYSREELLKMTLSDVDSSFEIDDHPKNIWEKLPAEGAIVVESVHRRKDGSTFPVEINIGLLEIDNHSFYLGITRDISERKQTEAALRESEAKLKSVFRAAPIGIGLVINRVFRWTNQRLTEICGYTSDELQGRSSRMLYPSDEAFESVGREKYDQIKEQGTGTVETKWRRKDGTIIDILLSSTPIDLDDLTAGVTFTALDITVRKQAEQMLVQQNGYINNLIESLTHPFYVIDVNNYTIQMANTASGLRDRGQNTTCYALTHKTNKSCNDVEHPCPLELIKQTGKPTVVEHIHFDANGNQRYVEVHAYPVFDSDGNLSQMIEYTLDITERKQTEEALAAEKERLAVTLRSIGDGVITTDTKANIIFLNKMAEDLTGWRQEEAIGLPLGKVFHIIDAQTRELCENPVDKVMGAGKIIGLANHTALIARDGTERSIADSGAPIRDAESRIIGVVLVFRDVTEKIRMEGELLKVKKLESVGVLAGGIAHDFNNILMAILGNLNLATMFMDADAEVYPLLKDAEKASLRARDLTQQLLTFSKGGEPVKETASIPEVIKDSADFVLHGGNVVCRYNMPDDLWLVAIDKGQVSQVIQNIIINAKHAMPEGGTIEITCENVSQAAMADIPLPKKDYLKITISDQGVGIHDNIIDKIFDPFFSTKQQGSGLGLAITHSIIIKHHGHITVRSEPGAGSTFSIYLPASTTAKKQKKQQKASFLQGKGRVMVMDDEEIVRNVAKSMLAHFGYDVVLAKNGAEAIKVYKKSITTDEPIDVVIMDLTIPGGMGGQEAVQGILAIDPDAKVIVSSGYSNDPVMANYQDYGFCGAAVKPYQLAELGKILGGILS